MAWMHPRITNEQRLKTAIGGRHCQFRHGPVLPFAVCLTAPYTNSDEALDAYGRHLIDPDDMVILLVPMSAAREEEVRRARLGDPDETPNA